MLDKKSSHLQKLMICEAAVAKQFTTSEQELNGSGDESLDPLQEDKHEVVRGLVHKYRSRVLCLLTAECASYCRFCTRRRRVSDIEHGRISEGDIERWVEYLRNHPEISEVILSGGDPFVVSTDIFRLAVEKICSIPTIKVLRIGTRAPVSAPELVTDEKLDIIKSVKQPVYVGVHFEHPAELTDETIEALTRLRRSGATLYSQTVFLSGINDDYDTLYNLFTRLLEVGVRPYYIYRCDPVVGIGHFIVDPQKERHIMTELRKNLSGLACPTYVIDTPYGSGKIPVPLEFWDADVSYYRDFDGEPHNVVDR